VLVYEEEVDIFMALNYFVIKRGEEEEQDAGEDESRAVMHIVHKRSPHFERDLIRPLPDFDMKGHEEVPEVKVIQALYAKWNVLD